MATTATEENKRLARRVVAGINEQNLAVFDEHFAVNVIDHTPFGETTGLEALKETVDVLFTAFPDYSATIEELIAEGDTIALRATNRGTHEGNFMGIEPTGEQFEMESMAFARMKDGKVVERWVQNDLLGLFQHLGVVDLPGE